VTCYAGRWHEGDAMNDDCLVRRQGDLIAQQTAQGMVVLDVATGALYGLNLTAALIWATIEASMTPNAIVEEMERHFDAELPIIRRDVVAMLDILVDQGIISID
jgi:hypothetical protein